MTKKINLKYKKNMSQLPERKKFASDDGTMISETLLKKIIKSCKSSTYSNKLKQVLLKLEENSKFISNERNKLNLNLNEQEKIRAFESEMILKHPPVRKYWEQLQKINLKVNNRKPDKTETEIKNEKLPRLKKKGNMKRKHDKEDGPVELFPSDESDVEFPVIESNVVEKKKQKKKKKPSLYKQSSEKIFDNTNTNEDEEDIVKDLNIADF